MNDFYLELRRAWFYGQATVEKVLPNTMPPSAPSVQGEKLY